MAFLGIDLGTTNSIGMIYDDKTDKTTAVTIEGIDEVLPSVVTYLEDETLIGIEAKNSAIIYPDETVLSVKRLMGETEPLDLGITQKLPEEVSADLLKVIKDSAQKQAGETFDEVVITHPAYFNDRQIYATKQAGELAGFQTVHLLSEPLAAAIEYGYQQNYVQKILIYDLGGGTFDACVLDVSKDIYGHHSFKELADVGDMFLGGDDFDKELERRMAKEFEANHDMLIDTLPIEDQRRVIQRLRQEAEKAKRLLSEAGKVTIQIHPLAIVDSVPCNLTMEVTRDEFEGMIQSYIDRSLEVVDTAIERSKLSVADIDKVILVGGSTLVPMVKRRIAGAIKEPYRAVDPAKSVAMGAAIYNYLIHLPNSSVEIGQIMRQHIGTRAIINAETGEKAMVPILKMGTEIPAKITDDGFQVSGNADAVRIDVFQWEEGFEEDRKYIGSLTLEGVTKESRLAITYSINKDNLFEATVVDEVTQITVSNHFDRQKTAPLLVDEKQKVTGSVKGIDICFIIDTTGSMDTYIDGVKEKAIRFSEILKEKGIDYQLGLIGFGDLGEREKPKVYKWTEDVAKFQKNVMRIKRTYGGDIPESSLEAIQTGIASLKKRAKVNPYTAFIVITDAPPHIPTHYGQSLEDIIDEVKAADVICHIVAKKDKKSLEAYTPFATTGGYYYSMDEPFHEILDRIAYRLADLVRV